MRCRWVPQQDRSGGAVGRRGGPGRRAATVLRREAEVAAFRPRSAPGVSTILGDSRRTVRAGEDDRRSRG